MYWTKFTKLCDVILNNALVYAHCILLLCYQKIVILAHLVLKRILEYSLGAQKEI